MGSVLQQILLATVASGCGGIDTGGFETPLCTSEAEPSILGDVALPDAPDYVELRMREGISPDAEIVAETLGDACATAVDAQACQAAIASATSPQAVGIGQCVQVCSEIYLVANRGDGVSVLATREELLLLLGDIDTPGEAVTMARLAGYQVSCTDAERGGAKRVGDGYEVIATKLTSDCDPVTTERYRLAVSRSGNVTEIESETLDSKSGACVGRRPSCAEEQCARGTTRLGAYFGSVAHLEELAVYAFAELGRELAHHGAPAELIARAAEARRDEVRHGAIMRAVAARFGGRAPEPRVTEQPPRSLEELARDNAVEGCVRETFGALVGMWQARFARDPQVRAVMRGVAADEARHAELSWDIDRWVRSRLDADALARVDRARDEALHELEHDEPFDAELVECAGLPAAAAQRELARRFAAQLLVSISPSV